MRGVALAVHSGSPAKANEPGSQGEQSVVPRLSVVPAAQIEQNEEASFEVRPAGQALQSCALGSSV